MILEPWYAAHFRTHTSGETHGTMVFDRKDYGMKKGILFVRIGDSVDVTVDL